jgi:hypothetical protein
VVKNTLCFSVQDAVAKSFSRSKNPFEGLPPASSKVEAGSMPL